MFLLNFLIFVTILSNIKSQKFEEKIFSNFLNESSSENKNVINAVSSLNTMSAMEALNDIGNLNCLKDLNATIIGYKNLRPWAIASMIYL